MKDLYKHLGVDPFVSSADEIRRAIYEAVDEDLAQDAAHILLNDGRREIYDRTHHSLVKIGQLRARMGVPVGIVEAAIDLTDFRYPKTNCESELVKLERTKARTLLRDNIRALVALLTSAVVVAAIVAVIYLYFPSERERRPMPPLTSDLTKAQSENQKSYDLGRRARPGTVQLTPSYEKAESETLATNDVNTLAAVAEDEPPLPTPLTGTVRFLNGYQSKPKYAPFEVSTPQGGGHHLIKLVDEQNDEVGTFFIREGDTLRVDVPLGTFELRYAFGENWYGVSKRFGPSTRYAMTDTPLQFAVEGNRASGNVVVLIKQIDGNLETHPISDDEF